MRIAESLNFVIPIYGDDDTIVGYVHSIPLSRSAFEANYLLISATFAAVYAQGLGEVAGPRVAALVLQDVAKDRKADPTPLLNEIQRLSCYIHSDAKGWTTTPLQQAAAQKVLSEDDVAEVMSALVFFTAASRMLPRGLVKTTLDGAARLWGAQTTSLHPTEWINSLPTSSETAATTETVSTPTVGGLTSTLSLTV